MKTLLIVLLVLLLLGFVPVGMRAEYGAQGPRFWIRVAGIRIPIAVRTAVDAPKVKKIKKESPRKKAKSAAKKQPVDVFELIREVSGIALEAAQTFRRKLWVEELNLVITVGATDPAQGAIRYGQANALLAAVWYPLTRVFQIKQAHARVELDGQSDGIALQAALSVTLKIWQIFALGLNFGQKGLRAVFRVRRRRSQRDKLTAQAERNGHHGKEKSN